ncbi:MAG TPA: hypothetical protein VGE52_04260 [Pirellulales bacterium]
MLGSLDNQEIKRRLVAAGVATAVMWDRDGNPLPRDPGVSAADYNAAKAILAAAIAAGPRRFKTAAELWAEFAALPPAAQQAWSTAVVVVVGREFAKGDPARSTEIAGLAAWLLGEVDPELRDDLAEAGQLDFEMTTTEPVP